MKRIALLVTAIITLVASSAIFAAQPGFYAGVLAGYTKADEGDSTFSVSQDNVGGGLYGGYNFQVASPLLLGIDVSGLYLGDYKVKDMTTNASDDGPVYGLSIGPRLTYLATQNLNLFTKVGWIKESNQFHNTDSGADLSVGAGYSFAQNWDLTFSYQHIFGDSLTDANELKTTGVIVKIDQKDNLISYNNVFLGLQYNF